MFSSWWKSLEFTVLVGVGRPETTPSRPAYVEVPYNPNMYGPGRGGSGLPIYHPAVSGTEYFVGAVKSIDPTQGEFYYPVCTSRNRDTVSEILAEHYPAGTSVYIQTLGALVIYAGTDKGHWNLPFARPIRSGSVPFDESITKEALERL